MKAKIMLRWMSLALLATLVAACSDGASTSPVSAPADANTTPAAAVTSMAALMQQGNLNGLLKASLPAADYQAVRKAWATSDFKTEPVDAEDRAKFATQMQKLTAPNAEQKLFNELKPQLEQFNSKYKAMVPMYIGMGQTMAATAIDKSTTMTAQAKQQAKDVVAALANWVRTTNWGDETKAKQAIAIAVDAARKLDIKTIDQARALNWDQAMHKYSTVSNAVKRVLAIYGLDIDQMLGSVEAKTIASKDGKATVAYTYSVLGQPLKGQIDLVKRDGHWYNPKFIQHVEEELADEAADAASSAAPAKPTPAPAK